MGAHRGAAQRRLTASNHRSLLSTEGSAPTFTPRVGGGQLVVRLSEDGRKDRLRCGEKLLFTARPAARLAALAVDRLDARRNDRHAESDLRVPLRLGRLGAAGTGP